MNAPPTNTFPPPGHQQMPYTAGFDPSTISRPNSFPYPPQHQQHQQHQQPQYPNQQPNFPQQQGFPPRGQPQYFQHPNQHGNVQSPGPNGRPGAINHPGAFQGLEGIPSQGFSAPPYNPSMSTANIASSMPQPVPSSFPATTSAPPQSNPAMATPQLASPNTPMQQHQKPPMPNGAFAGQMQTPAQAPGALVPPLSPKSATREKLRVTLLLEINSHLLSEIVALQAQGKSGVQPSPSQDGPAGSPMSATDPQASLNSSPQPGGGSKQASSEYADCMRRLQANLSYLAAVADRHKRTAATFPAAPAIMTPPPNLQNVRELYKKLNAVFPGVYQQQKMAAQAAAHQGQMNTTAPAVQPHTGL